MPIKNKLIYIVSMTAVFFAMILLIYLGDITTFSGFIVLLVIYLPLFLSGIWFGFTGLILPILTTLLLAIIDLQTAIFFLMFFILPVIAISFISLKHKNVRVGHIVSFILIYVGLIILFVTSYYKDFFSFSAMYNNIYFSVIAINSVNKTLFSEIEDISSFVQVVAFFSPAIISIIWAAWVLLNYRVAIGILDKTGNLTKKVNMDDYFLVKGYNILFIGLVLLVLIGHNLLAKNVNLLYTLYNVLLVALSAYLYLGMDYIWKGIRKVNSILLVLAFLVIMVLLFIEIIILMSIVGFLVSIRAISYKN